MHDDHLQINGTTSQTIAEAVSLLVVMVPETI